MLACFVALHSIPALPNNGAFWQQASASASSQTFPSNYGDAVDAHDTNDDDDDDRRRTACLATVDAYLDEPMRPDALRQRLDERFLANATWTTGSHTTETPQVLLCCHALYAQEFFPGEQLTYAGVEGRPCREEIDAALVGGEKSSAEETTEGKDAA